MKIAFLFPGQGAQKIGMGKDLYENYEEVRNIYQKVSEISQIDIAKLCFEGRKEAYNGNMYVDTQMQETGFDLDQTENTQLAIATMSLAILEICKKEQIEADILAGLSLGEYPALIHGEYLSFEEGIQLLKQRGYYMQHEVPDESYAMVAVMGLESNQIEQVCKQIQEEGLFVAPANYNYTGQTVISGNIEAVKKAQERLASIGAKRQVELNTSGPFHTKKLEKAEQLYKRELEKVKFLSSSKKVIKNIDGTFYHEKEDMADILAKHIISPVRFDKAIQKMLEEGIDTFIEIGPGKALTGFVKKENKEVNTYQIYDIDSLEKTIDSLKNRKGE